MRVTLLVLMGNVLVMGWCAAKGDMLWLVVNSVFAFFGAVSLVRKFP